MNKQLENIRETLGDHASDLARLLERPDHVPEVAETGGDVCMEAEP